MTEDEPTDEHQTPDGEPPTQAGAPRPSQLPAYPPQPPPAPAPPPSPQQPYQYPTAPQPAYQQPQPAPQETVQGGGGTLWLRPDSGVHAIPPREGPVGSPVPPANYGAPVAQPHNPYATPYPGYPPAAYVPTEPSNSKAIAALVLGIVGLVMFVSGLGIAFIINLPCSILAWIFGVQGKKLVDQGVTSRGDGAAKAGLWMGAVGTILGGLAAIFWIIVIIAAIADS